MSLLPSLCASMQRFVVDQPNATQRAAPELFLFLGWLKAVSVGFFSQFLHYSIYLVRNTTVQLWDILAGLTPIIYPPFPATVNPTGITGASTGEER